MHEAVSFNNQIIRAEDALISALSSASLYGLGIFTTIAVYDGTPFLWEKHWSRLKVNSAKLGIDISKVSEETVRRAFDQIVSDNAMENGRARITIFDESTGAVWRLDGRRESSILITTGEFRETPHNPRLTVSPFPINSASPLAGVKSCNYLEKTVAQNEAKERGFDEAVGVNEHGEVTSACMANLFWLKDGKLFTPSLETGCLAGTTREYLIGIVECFEVRQPLESIREADAVFLTSAGIGMVQAAGIDELEFPNPDHPILSLVPNTRKNTKPREN